MRYSMSLQKIHKVISSTYKRIQEDPYELKHLLTLGEQKPDIHFTICTQSDYPYQVFDDYYFNNNFRINNHSIIIPQTILKKIIDTGFHTGISANEFHEYAGVSPLSMKRSELVSAIAIHELSHVFQLYIQDYYTEEDHTKEFYDVLQGFYSSSVPSRLIDQLTFLDN